MLARDKLSGYGFVLVGVGEGAGVGMEVCMRWLALNEVGSAVAPGEAFTDYLISEAEVGAAFIAAEVRGVTGEEFVSGRVDGDRIEVEDRRNGRSG